MQKGRDLIFYLRKTRIRFLRHALTLTSVRRMGFAIAFFSALVFSGGCSLNSSTQNSAVPIPNVDLDCFPSQNSLCDSLNHQKPFFVGLIVGKLNLENGINCTHFILSGFTNPGSAFDASASVNSTFFVDHLEASVTTWTDSDGNAIPEIPFGDYTACAFLDANEDGLLNDGEPKAQIPINTNQLFQVITEWETH